ncbi:MAG TPA: aldo/keto reductase [Bacteroidetes bacterium]|nr:aldo/keto reductase [Bacteroidota bacterium]
MKKISRRKFLQQSVAGSAVIAANTNNLFALDDGLRTEKKIDRVVLGKSGVKISRIAFGTGTNGWKFKSSQTRLGEKEFIDLAYHAYNSGITFFDAADIYGSHQYVRRLLGHISRENMVIMSKIWTEPNDWLTPQNVPDSLDRFRRELGTDYIDIVLLHCQTAADWPEIHKKMRDDLAAAKEKGIIRAHGVSCHSPEALQTAADYDWVDVLLARINPLGIRMDDKPAKVMPVLRQARKNGKGVLGMKIFGCGQLTAEPEREKSLRYVLGSGNVDAMTIGFENKHQIDDTISRVNRIMHQLSGNKS